MNIKRVGLGLLVMVAAGAALVATDHVPGAREWLGSHLNLGHAGKEGTDKSDAAPPPAVSVVRASSGHFQETVLVTGSLVPREEILVGPEIDGLRVVEVLADEGDRVTKGQVLARLVSDTLDAQLAQNAAALAKTEAAIAQAESAINSAKARMDEARNAYNRAKPLTRSGYLSESGMDQRESARLTAEAALASARDGLKLAGAERDQVKAQRREIMWRRERTDIRAPADGIVSRRLARIGGYASGAAEPMFRIIAKGEIELDAEISETSLHKVKVGQHADIDVSGIGHAIGTVRLVSPEVDRTTRLGRARIFIGDRPDLRIGSFARATIKTAASDGLTVPATAILYGKDGETVQVVVDGQVRVRAVKLGLRDEDRVEVLQGLAEGDAVVARSGTFLRDGDRVKPVPVPLGKLAMDRSE
ncbi:MAG: efflux RND transporter periplasmic adaptor subunit [Hyphomicrobiaceae bacterium]